MIGMVWGNKATPTIHGIPFVPNESKSTLLTPWFTCVRFAMFSSISGYLEVLYHQKTIGENAGFCKFIWKQPVFITQPWLKVAKIKNMESNNSRFHSDFSDMFQQRMHLEM